MRQGRQAPAQQELGLALAPRDGAHHVLVESGRQRVGLDLGDEAVRIGLLQRAVQRLGLAGWGAGVHLMHIVCIF
jgi:hypothetical protein